MCIWLRLYSFLTLIIWKQKPGHCKNHSSQLSKNKHLYWLTMSATHVLEEDSGLLLNSPTLAVHGVPKSQTWLSDFTFTFHFHALEKEMATHSSVLAWRIPWREEPGGLPSMGSHRVGHDWSDLAAAALLQRTWILLPSHTAGKGGSSNLIYTEERW